MKVVSFLTEHAVVDRIIDHLKLTFVADKPSPARVFEPAALIRRPHGGRRNAALRVAEESRGYFMEG